MKGKKQAGKYAALVGNRNAAKEQPRSKVATVRFTAAEYDGLMDEARSQGKTLAEYMREWVLPR